MIQKIRQPLQLSKIIDQLDSNDAKKAIAIAGKVNNRKTRTLNAIYEYKSKKQTLTTFENKLANQINYSQPTSLSQPKIVADITRNLKTNLKPENYVTKRTPKFLKNHIAKKKAKKINRIFDNLNAVTSNQYLTTRTQALFPILTTISTLGTSLGVPLLSIALIRIKEIEEFAGPGGFAGFVTFCLIIILVGISALFFYLFTTIRYNRLQRISISVDEVFSKIIENCFILPNQDINSKRYGRQKLSKFKITTSGNIFYNEIDIDDKHYDEILKLILILVNLNNNVVFTVNINAEHEIKQIYNPNIFNNNFLVMDVNNFKTPTNYRMLLDFLLNELSSIFQINCQHLFFRNKKFSKIINAFLDEATANFQLIQLINFSQKYIGPVGDQLTKEKYLTFFLDFFTLLTLRAISDPNYLYFVNELQSSYLINEKLYGNIYVNLQVRKMISDNWKRYKTNSILFSLDEIFENDKWFANNFENLEPNVQIEDINIFEQVKQYIKRQGFNKSDETLENNEIYIDSNADKILLCNIPSNCDNLFDFINQKFKAATDNAILYICFLFRFVRIFMKYNDSRFEIMPETVI